MASPELEFIVAALRSAPIFEGAEDGPITPALAEKMRAGMEALTASTPKPDEVSYVEAEADGVRGEWVTAPASRVDRVLLYLHGGGYVVGSPRTHRGLTGSLAQKAGVRVFALDYRLAPEHPHPAAVEDAVAAYRQLLAQGIAAEHIAVAGDSAGGGLTAATFLALRDRGLPLPRVGVLISPWLDLTQSGVSMRTKADLDPMVKQPGIGRMAEAYLGGADGRTPLASPLFADLRGLPEMLVHVGTAETLLDDSLRFVECVRAAGGEISLDVYEDMIHVWHAFETILPEARQAVEAIADFVRRRLN